MAKPTRARAVKKETESGLNKFSIDTIIPRKYQSLAGVGVIFVLFFIFFYPLFFQGKTFQSGDILTGASFKTLIKTTGHQLLWNPYIFCGMPSQATGVGYTRWFDVINTTYVTSREMFGNIFGNDYAQHVAVLIILSVTAFFFMRSKKASLLVSLFVASAISFSTGIIVFIFIGHITKLYTLAMFPLVLMLLQKLQNKIKLLDVVLLVIAIGFLVAGWHIQVIFYCYFAFGLYFLYYLIHFLMKKDYPALKQLVKTLAIFVVATGLALSMAVDMYGQLYEYSPFSTRGTKSIVEKTTGPDATSGSAFYNYATEWSFSPGEVLTFVVPSYYGFGNTIYKGPLSNDQEIEVNTYFGQMNFVDVAMYMGVIVFFLGLFAMYACRKDPFVKYLTVLVVVSLLISFGRNFSPLFDLMFYYFPMFNKFRVPSMMLVLVQVSFPLLAGFGLLKIISLRAERNDITVKIIKYAAFVFTGGLVLSLVANGAISGWFMERVATSARAQELGQISEFMADAFMKDLYVALFLSAAVFWLAYGYIENKIGKDALIIVVILLSVFDLFRVSGRGAKFVEKQDVTGFFVEPAHIKVIKQQQDKDPFRMINLKSDGSLGSVSRNSNYNMFFLIQDLTGYSGIKPRAYQDYADVVTPANLTLWRMLNVKYIVYDKAIQYPGLVPIYANDKTFVYRNDGALPRAYFVNKVEVKQPIDILNAVKDNQFDPKDIAYTSTQLTVDKPDSSAYVHITKYDNDKISINANATGNNFMFLGDIYYSKGWSATVDGKETTIYEANHGFRGIIVPKGRHDIEFIFAPKSYTIGKNISLGVNLLLIAGLIVGIVIDRKKKDETEAS